MASHKHERPKIGGWPLATGIAVVLVFLFFVRHILLPFILAAALAFLLTPAVDFIHRRYRLARWIAAVGVYFAVVALLGALGYFLGGLVLQELTQFIHELPRLLHRLIEEAVRYGGSFIGPSANANAVTAAVLAQIQSMLGAREALTLAGYGVAAIFGSVLALVLLLYFLISGREIARGAFWLIPPEYRGETDALAAKILPVLWRYFAGLLAVVTYTSTLAGIAFGPVFRVPHAALMAIVVGLLELIPVIGPAASLSLIGLEAMQLKSPWAMIALAVFAVALRLSIDQLVGPLVLGKAAKVHPVVVIFAFLSGAVLFGVIGLLLAVPVAASIKIILSNYYAEPIADRK